MRHIEPDNCYRPVYPHTRHEKRQIKGITPHAKTQAKAGAGFIDSTACKPML